MKYNLNLKYKLNGVIFVKIKTLDRSGKENYSKGNRISRVFQIQFQAIFIIFMNKHRFSLKKKKESQKANQRRP